MGRGKPSSGPRQDPKRPKEASVRLDAILARASRETVIFRRGPSKHVQLLRWNRGTDRVEAGQWFKGRVYTQRCDLSPNGKLLVYFAAKFNTPEATWTAVSRPPYFTALAFWRKGDAWGGGGHFDAKRVLRLNHRPGREFVLHEKSRPLPADFELQTYGPGSGGGEDYPIIHDRRCREGWHQRHEGVRHEHPHGSEIWIEYDPAWSYAKTNRAYPKLTLVHEIVGIHVRNGPWYKMRYRIEHEKGWGLDLGELDWADWDDTGEVLFGRDGQIVRAKVAPEGLTEKLVVDLRAHRFQAVPPPPEALRWD